MKHFDLAAAYEEAAEDAYWDELQRAAHYHISNEDTPNA